MFSFASFKIFNQCNSDGRSRKNAANQAILLVTSKYDHFDVRSTHRKHFNRTLLRKSGIGRRLFLLGNPPPDRKEVALSDAAIQAENAINGDLIQGDFADNYRNLSIKHLLGLHYIQDHCKKFRYRNLKNQSANYLKKVSNRIKPSYVLGHAHCTVHTHNCNFKKIFCNGKHSECRLWTTHADLLPLHLLNQPSPILPFSSWRNWHCFGSGNKWQECCP